MDALHLQAVPDTGQSNSGCEKPVLGGLELLFDGIAVRIGFHDMRHSFAVTSLQAEDDIKTVQANLGHATAAFTLDVYGHVTEKMRKDSAARMQQFYKQIKK